MHAIAVHGELVVVSIQATVTVMVQLLAQSLLCPCQIIKSTTIQTGTYLYIGNYIQHNDTKRYIWVEV